MDVNAIELEKQRRKSILDSGKYIRLEMLIGKEEMQLNGKYGYAPCTSIEMKSAGPGEVGALYMYLQEISTYLEKEYPTACLYAKLTRRVKKMGDFEFKPDNEEEE